MSEKFTYQYSHQLGIFYKYYYGDITIEDINSSWDYIIRNHIIPPETRCFVLDYRNAVISIPADQHTAIVDYYKNHPEVFRDSKIAVLSENPLNVVFSILVESKEDGFQTKPFSTMQAATFWVLE